MRRVSVHPRKEILYEYERQHIVMQQFKRNNWMKKKIKWKMLSSFTPQMLFQTCITFNFSTKWEIRQNISCSLPYDESECWLWASKNIIWLMHYISYNSFVWETEKKLGFYNALNMHFSWVHTQSYQMTLEDLDFCSWVIWTTFIIVLCTLSSPHPLSVCERAAWTFC